MTSSFNKIKQYYVKQTGKPVMAKTDWCTSRLSGGGGCSDCAHQQNCADFNEYVFSFLTVMNEFREEA